VFLAFLESVGGVLDLVILSSDLRPYVLETRVKRGAELSTDHHLVVSWIRWRGSLLERPSEQKKRAGELGTSDVVTWRVEAIEKDFRLASRRFWQTIRRLRKGKQSLPQAVLSGGRGELLTRMGVIAVHLLHGLADRGQIQDDQCRTVDQFFSLARLLKAS